MGVYTWGVIFLETSFAHCAHAFLPFWEGGAGGVHVGSDFFGNPFTHFVAVRSFRFLLFFGKHRASLSTSCTADIANPTIQIFHLCIPFTSHHDLGQTPDARRLCLVLLQNLPLDTGNRECWKQVYPTVKHTHIHVLMPPKSLSPFPSPPPYTPTPISPPSTNSPTSSTQYNTPYHSPTAIINFLPPPPLHEFPLGPEPAKILLS